jgi:hypothetical protein
MPVVTVQRDDKNPNCHLVTGPELRAHLTASALAASVNKFTELPMLTPALQ